MNPTPVEIRELRLRIDITQARASELVFVSRRTWQDWEAGKNRMPAGLWELFQLKVRVKQLV